MPGETWQDLAKDYVLWQSQRGGNVELMVQRTRTNSRTNQDLAQFTMSVQAMTDNWRGKYKNLYGNIFDRLEEQYLVMEAFSRKQCIELAAAVARASAPAPGENGDKKHGGIMGLLGR